MRSVRLLGAVLSAVAAVATYATSAVAQTGALGDACGPLGPTMEGTRGGDCRTAEAARTGVLLLFGLGGLFGTGPHATVSRGTPSPGIEYFTGGSSLDVFQSALNSAHGQGEATRDNPLAASVAGATLPWQGLFVGGSLMWLSLEVSHLFWVASPDPVVNPQAIFDDALQRKSRAFDDDDRTHHPASYDPTDYPVGVVTSREPVTSTPEPGSMALIATGLVSFGAVQIRRRRRS